MHAGLAAVLGSYGRGGRVDNSKNKPSNIISESGAVSSVG